MGDFNFIKNNCFLNKKIVYYLKIYICLVITEICLMDIRVNVCL